MSNVSKDLARPTRFTRFAGLTRFAALAPIALLTLPLLGGALAACGDDDDATATASPDGGSSTNEASSGGPFTSPADPGPGGFLVTVSGEDLAAVGYDWAAGALSEGDPPAFVDGWAVTFEHVIVTVDKIRVNADPDKDEANPTSVGELVASADGPFAIDATIGGSLVGKSGSPDEKVVAIAAFAKQANGQPFDPATRYAFSYAVTAASSSAKIVNLDAEGLALYEEGKQKGWSMILAGTARFKGPLPSADAGAGDVFAKIPTEVKFKLGLKNPSSYINCRNADLAMVGDEFPRGIQANASASTTVQITMHTDHAFWDRLNVEGTPLHFDPIAAQASTYGTPGTPGVVTIEDLANVDVTGFKTKAGESLPWRSLVSDYTAPDGQMKYDPNGTTFTAANSFAAYLAYSAASGGHMNADGECEVKNDFVP